MNTKVLGLAASAILAASVAHADTATTSPSAPWFGEATGLQGAAGPLVLGLGAIIAIGAIASGSDT